MIVSDGVRWRTYPLGELSRRDEPSCWNCDRPKSHTLTTSLSPICVPAPAPAAASEPAPRHRLASAGGATYQEIRGLEVSVEHGGVVAMQPRHSTASV